MSGELLLGESRLLRCERRKSTLHDLLAAMLDDEFDAEQVGAYVCSNASNIAEGFPNLSVIPCSVRIDEFSTNMAKARRGYHSTDEFQQIFRRRRDSIRRWLLDHYDFTIIDCPPSIALQVRVFLTVADAFVLPSVPDRLSVRGSLWMLDRIRKFGVKIRPLGTLWSLYRKQNAMHRKIIEATAKGISPYDQLPLPFETIIPNSSAIADSTEPDKNPASFSLKYTQPFAKLYRNLCEEIIVRTGFEPTELPNKELVGSK
jgi:chromosome partitioning protein